MIFEGSAGAISSTSDTAKRRPLGRDRPNNSPSCTLISDCVMVPKPILSRWRKRTQWLTMETSQELRTEPRWRATDHGNAIMQKPGILPRLAAGHYIVRRSSRAVQPAPAPYQA